MRSARPDDTERRFDMLAPFRFRQLGENQRQLDVLKRGEHGDQVVHLEDEAHVPRAPLRQLAAGHVGDLIAVDRNAAG